MTDPDESADLPDGDGHRYPLDWRDLQPSQQAKGGLMSAKEYNLVVGARIFDFANEIQVKAFHDELGPKARRPRDDGVYHLFWIAPEAENASLGPDDPKIGVPVLIPQDSVPWFLLGVGICDSVTSAQLFVGGPGTLPLNDPTEDADDYDDHEPAEAEDDEDLDDEDNER